MTDEFGKRSLDAVDRATERIGKTIDDAIASVNGTADKISDETLKDRKDLSEMYADHSKDIRRFTLLIQVIAVTYLLMTIYIYMKI